MSIKTKTTIRVETHKITVVRPLHDPVSVAPEDMPSELQRMLPAQTDIDEDTPQITGEKTPKNPLGDK